VDQMLLQLLLEMHAYTHVNFELLRCPESALFTVILHILAW